MCYESDTEAACQVRHITKKFIRDIQRYDLRYGCRFLKMPTQAVMDLLTRNKKYPIVNATMHNGVEIRCKVRIDDEHDF